MDVVLKDGLTVRVRRAETPEKEGLICSRKCPFFKTHEWEEGPMERTRLTYSCELTGESEDFLWDEFMGNFVIIRTEECTKRDHDPQLPERRGQILKKIGHYLKEYPMPTSYSRV